MRILLVTEASGSGTLGVVTTLAVGMTSAGHEVTLAYGRRPETPADLRALVGPQCALVPLPWTRRSSRAQLAAARALRALVTDVRPDVVHLHSSFAGAVGALALGDVPRVYTPHGYAFARTGDGRVTLRAYRAAERLIARRCRVIAVSDAEAELARTAARATRVTVVRNGIGDLDGAFTACPDRAAPAVVGLGRIGPARRPRASARILRAVAEQARVAWIGDAPGAATTPLHAAGVPVTGWLPHAQALAELERATVLLHWSAWDGAALSVLEAIARDVVVVASDIPPNRELLGPGQVCAGEREAIELIGAVLRDGGLRARLLRDQRERGRSRGAQRMIDECLAVYARETREAAWT